jgi:hypothetical protein
VENVSVSIASPFFLTARVDPWLDHTPYVRAPMFTTAHHGPPRPGTVEA